MRAIKFSLACIFCVAGLAATALAHVPESAADSEYYSFTVNEYFNGAEVGSSTGGAASQAAEYSAMQCCAPSEPGGIPACFMLMVPASTDSTAAWALIKEALCGNILPQLREVMFHGFRIYYSFPYANDVKFTLGTRDAATGAELVVDSITIAQ